jgi:hypothetical protein
LMFVPPGEEACGLSDCCCDVFMIHGDFVCFISLSISVTSFVGIFFVHTVHDCSGIPIPFTYLLRNSIRCEHSKHFPAILYTPLEYR